MTNLTTQSGAILAAMFITLVSMGTTITVPPAEAAALIMPVLA